MQHTHTVTQTAPDGTTVDAKLYENSNAQVEEYVRSMKADNPDYRYTWRPEVDPNATLAEIRRLQAEWPDIDDDGDQAEALADLAIQVERLDVWLSKGGFLPEAWTKGRA